MSKFKKVQLAAHMVECTGEAHRNPMGYDHCMVCMPNWGEYPVECTGEGCTLCVKGNPVVPQLFTVRVSTRIYTVLTPEGHEVILGEYASAKAANAAYRRQYPADWRGRACGTLAQREVLPGERVKRGAMWTDALMNARIEFGCIVLGNGELASR